MVVLDESVPMMVKFGLMLPESPNTLWCVSTERDMQKHYAQSTI